MVREDEIDILDPVETSLVLLPFDVLQKLLKTKDDERTVKWICENNGTVFHISSIYENIEVIKKYIVETDERGKHLHEVIEIKTADSRNAERYLLKNEMTCEEFIKNKVEELGIDSDEMVDKFSELNEEWQKSLG